MHQKQSMKLFMAGVGTITDVEETKARQTVSNAQLLGEIGNLEIRKRELVRIIGKLPVEIRRIDDAIELLIPPLDIIAWEETAAEQNLKVVIQKHNFRVADSMFQQ